MSEYPHIVKIHEKAEKLNAGRKPQFGDKMRNLVAGEGNPRRDAYFVKQKTVTGRLNPGMWYTMTDGEGSFWDSCPKGLIFIDD
ncbi:hypothetical protein [Citrobacter meridianamericanus]|uniref:Uncharacterized protein n=1 Tax=Citrobacter meridianamericanus TaxID=2894201 RepID=A0ABT1B8D1_9ENTR|nr:hypothetical protein [Citrobacter meridianamericanus]